MNKSTDRNLKRLSKIGKKLSSQNADTNLLSERVLSKWAALLSQTTASLEASIRAERHCHELELRLLAEEIKGDQMDRDANDAKALDRCRIAAERGEKASAILLRSKDAINSIEADLAQSCPWNRTKICRSVSAFEPQLLA